MSILLTIVGIIFAILQIMLFFKLWGMTNDVREIKNKYINADCQQINDVIENDIDIPLDGKIVVNLSTNKQMRVNGITDEGKFKCYTGGVHIGDFARDEIIDFNLWVKTKKKYKEDNTNFITYICVIVAILVIIIFFISLITR